MSTSDDKEPKEPKRRAGEAPTMNTRGVAGYLGVSVEWIHQLVERGPENNGLAAYMIRDDGQGYQRKLGRAKEYGGRDTMFYESDVADWLRRNPVQERARQRVEYSAEEKKQVQEFAEPEMSQHGYVTRTAVARRLREKYGYSQRFYSKLKQICDDLRYPYPPNLKDTRSHRHRHI